MDIEVLGDARTDLAIRLAQMCISHITGGRDDAVVAAEEWLLELESAYPNHLTVIEGTIEFHVEVGAGAPQNGVGIDTAIEFYILSLWEWKTFGNGGHHD